MIIVDIIGIQEEKHGHMIHDAIQHTLSVLMPRRRKPLYIDVNVCEEGDMGPAVAMVHESDDDTYEITIDEALLRNEEDLISTICHECVHIKQYARKECKDVAMDQKTWKGQLYNLTEVNYYDLPWEQEAYMMEMILANEVLKKYGIG